MAHIDSPIPLSEIESVLAWVDSFKLSRSNKKISRDFSDAVLLAEILSLHYPKLVEMHNYPPRNSHALKLNNWMTLNRKVLKKLKLNLCCDTMDQLANCAPGVIERVLVMVRDKIRRDEEVNKSMKESEQNLSSGGSYYEACGDDELVLVVPVKTRVNGILETTQQKVIRYESYQAMKEEYKDAKDSIELLKQKVEHLDNLLKLKDERIDELQTQLDRKQARRKETEAFQNSLAVPFETVPSPVITDITPTVTNVPSLCNTQTIQSASNASNNPLRSIESLNKVQKTEETKIPITDIIPPTVTNVLGLYNAQNIQSVPNVNRTIPLRSNDSINKIYKTDESRIPVLKTDSSRSLSKPSFESVTIADEIKNVDRIKSDIFKDIDVANEKPQGFTDFDEFKDSEENILITIEDAIQKEIKEIIKPIDNV